MTKITFYTKPGCPLCDEALDLLLALGDELGVELAVQEINILKDAELYARYRYTIPVVAIDDGPTLMAPVGAADLRRALSQAVGRSEAPIEVK